VDLDHRLTRFIADHRFGPLTTFAGGLLNFVNNELALALIGLGVLAAIVVFRPIRAALTVAVATVSAYVIAELLKELIRRPRPPYQLAIAHPGGFSMPSTDATTTAAAAIALLIVTNWSSPRRRHIAMAIASTAVLVSGLCLIYLGVHWPSDVLAGWAIGIVTGALLSRLATTLQPLHAPRPRLLPRHGQSGAGHMEHRRPK
jgi:membrane-associated phospholipid phosphatase